MKRMKHGTCSYTNSLRVFASLFLTLTAAARADTANPGIAVVGAATVKGDPSVVVIQSSITGEAELAADASVKFLDTLKKATAALNAMKNPDLSVEPQGSTIDSAMDPAAQQRIMQGMGGTDTPKQRVQVSEQLQLVLKNADKLPPEKLMQTILKIVDTARDAGLQVGPPPPRNWQELQNQSSTGAMVTFKIPDMTALQEQAYKAAMDDARQKAQRLADLSGVKLGRVTAVADQGVTSSSERVVYYGGGNNSPDTSAVSKEVHIDKDTQIPVTVHLSVQFEIDK